MSWITQAKCDQCKKMLEVSDLKELPFGWHKLNSGIVCSWDCVKARAIQGMKDEKKRLARIAMEQKTEQRLILRRKKEREKEARSLESGGQ